MKTIVSNNLIYLYKGLEFGHCPFLLCSERGLTDPPIGPGLVVGNDSQLCHFIYIYIHFSKFSDSSDGVNYKKKTVSTTIRAGGSGFLIIRSGKKTPAGAPLVFISHANIHYLFKHTVTTCLGVTRS